MVQIFDPIKEFDNNYRELHEQKTKEYFDELAKKANVDVEANKKTVAEYNEACSNSDSQNKILKRWTTLRAFMIIAMIVGVIVIVYNMAFREYDGTTFFRFFSTVSQFAPFSIILKVLLPIIISVVIFIVCLVLLIVKVSPKIKVLRANIADIDSRAKELLEEAYEQVKPLNVLFDSWDCIKLVEATLPDLKFAQSFTAEQEKDMRDNFGFNEQCEEEMTTLDVLSGRYNENPFIFEKVRIHEMSTKTYSGSLDISWTTSYTDSQGYVHTETHTETLHANVTKPCPRFIEGNVLQYCAQSGSELTFSRSNSHWERESEKAVEKAIKSGQKKLDKLAAESMKNGGDFTSLANTEFEVMFCALDRNHEVQFRSFFTPLAQTNMVALMKDRLHYGDDFTFNKAGMQNTITAEHSENMPLLVGEGAYQSYSYEQIQRNFINYNAEYFKALYFTFAPVWAVTSCQEKPVNSLKPLPDYGKKYADKEYEILSNAMPMEHIVHPQTKTEAIIKSSFDEDENGVDSLTTLAVSYDIIERVDYIPVHGGDGYTHQVPVPWDEYILLSQQNKFRVMSDEKANEANAIVLASVHGLSITK